MRPERVILDLTQLEISRILELRDIITSATSRYNERLEAINELRIYAKRILSQAEAAQNDPQVVLKLNIRYLLINTILPEEKDKCVLNQLRLCKSITAYLRYQQWINGYLSTIEDDFYQLLEQGINTILSTQLSQQEYPEMVSFLDECLQLVSVKSTVPKRLISILEPVKGRILAELYEDVEKSVIDYLYNLLNGKIDFGVGLYDYNPELFTHVGYAYEKLDKEASEDLKARSRFFNQSSDTLSYMRHNLRVLQQKFGNWNDAELRLYSSYVNFFNKETHSGREAAQFLPHKIYTELTQTLSYIIGLMNRAPQNGHPHRHGSSAEPQMQIPAHLVGLTSALQVLGLHISEVAELDHHALIAEIKSAYRTKARLLHPDVNKDDGTTERMQQLNSAYQQLQFQLGF